MKLALTDVSERRMFVPVVREQIRSPETNLEVAGVTDALVELRRSLAADGAEIPTGYYALRTTHDVTRI